MDSSRRIVTRLPLEEIWGESGFVATERCHPLSAEGIKTLLRLGCVQFVVADVGRALRWISERDNFDFWKTEIRAHLAAPDEEVALDEFPGEYCYFASEWRGNRAVPIVLLEMCH